MNVFFALWTMQPPAGQERQAVEDCTRACVQYATAREQCFTRFGATATVSERSTHKLWPLCILGCVSYTSLFGPHIQWFLEYTNHGRAHMEAIRNYDTSCLNLDPNSWNLDPFLDSLHLKHFSFIYGEFQFLTEAVCKLGSMLKTVTKEHAEGLRPKYAHEQALGTCDHFSYLLQTGLIALARQLMMAMKQTSYSFCLDPDQRSFLSAWSWLLDVDEIESTMRLAIFMVFGESSGVDRSTVLATISDADQWIENDKRWFWQKTSCLVHAGVEMVMLLADQFRQDALATRCS